jgi:hypothetical protein
VVRGSRRMAALLVVFVFVVAGVMPVQGMQQITPDAGDLLAYGRMESGHGGGQLVVSAPLCEGPLTIVSTLVIGEDWDLDSAEQIWLAGLSTDPEGMMLGLAVVWAEASSGWFPLWKVQLQSQHGELVESVDLAALSPEAGHTYQSVLSYDPETGDGALQIYDQTAQRQVFSGGFEAKTPVTARYPAAGAVCGSASAVVELAELEAYGDYVPVDVELELVSDSQPAILRGGGYERTEQPAMRLSIPGVLPGGEFWVRVCHHDTGVLKELGPLRATANEIVVPFPPLELPGQATITLEYVSEGHRWFSRTWDISVGWVSVESATAHVDHQGGTIGLEMRLQSDAPTAALPLTVTGSLHFVARDRKTTEPLGKTQVSPLTFLSRAVDVGPEPSSIVLVAPMPDEMPSGLWEISLQVASESSVDLRCSAAKVPLATTPSLSPEQVVAVFYVAPEARGAANGSSMEHAASFREPLFWQLVQRSLQKGAVTVEFLPGQYVFSKRPKDGQSRGTLRLEGMGHDTHQLVLEGLHPQGTVFMSDPKEAADQSLSIDLLFFKGKNTVVRNLHFTGQQHMGYATRFYGEHVLVENCSWVDLPRVYYGATGTAYEDAHHITFKDCVFKRVGLDSHAHMIYNAYGPQHIYVVNCHFEDSSGEYVRFRDQTDYVVVFGCTFKSTGTYVGGNNVFISLPLFNDDDPGNPGPNPRYEYFGTHVLVANNTFMYPDDYSRGTRQVLRFLHRGFDPPGCQLLLDPNEAAILREGSLAERRAFMQTRLGIDGAQVYFYGNTYEGRGAKHSVTYDSAPNYGAQSRGWAGAVDITDAVNATPVVATAAEALLFWD